MTHPCLLEGLCLASTNLLPRPTIPLFAPVAGLALFFLPVPSSFSYQPSCLFLAPPPFSPTPISTSFSTLSRTYFLFIFLFPLTSLTGSIELTVLLHLQPAFPSFHPFPSSYAPFRPFLFLRPIHLSPPPPPFLGAFRVHPPESFTRHEQQQPSPLRPWHRPQRPPRQMIPGTTFLFSRFHRVNLSGGTRPALGGLERRATHVVRRFFENRYEPPETGRPRGNDNFHFHR